MTRLNIWLLASPKELPNWQLVTLLWHIGLDVPLAAHLAAADERGRPAVLRPRISIVLLTYQVSYFRELTSKRYREKEKEKNDRGSLTIV